MSDVEALRDRLIAAREAARSDSEVLSALADVEWFNNREELCPESLKPTSLDALRAYCANERKAWAVLFHDFVGAARASTRYLEGTSAPDDPALVELKKLLHALALLDDFFQENGGEIPPSVGTVDFLLSDKVFLEEHSCHLEIPKSERSAHPYARTVAGYLSRPPDMRSVSVTITSEGSMTRRPRIVSNIHRAAWLADVGVDGLVVDGEPIATRRADPADLFPSKRNSRRRRVHRVIDQQRRLALKDGGGMPRDLRLISLQELIVDPDSSAVLPNDVLTLLSYAHVVDRPMALFERDGAALLARHLNGDPRPVQSCDIDRFWEASAWLRSLVVYEPDGGFRWVPMAHVDVPAVRPVDQVTIGPPEWARPVTGAWTLTGEGSRASRARVIAGRYGLAGRIVTALEYRLGAARWDRDRRDRRSPYLRSASGRVGPGKVLGVPWRTTMILAGECWDREDTNEDKAALVRFNRAYHRLVGNKSRSYLVPDESFSKEARAGDTVEIMGRTRGGRGRPAELFVRASARFVEAARLAQLSDGKGFKSSSLREWAGL